MEFPKNFIAATTEFCTFENYVPAPLMRRSFTLEHVPQAANIIITGLGFYELYVNGTKVSKFLAPYISAPSDIVYYDNYDVTNLLTLGENVIGLILGNGMQNSIGGGTWDFEKASWRGAPKTALRLDINFANEEVFTLESDTTFKAHPSPIYFDDMRCGDYYDARNETPDWNLPGFDDSGWKSAIVAPTPTGEARFCTAEPITVSHVVKPVAIIKEGNGYLYDFGINNAGISQLKIKGGTPGQKISMTHGEYHNGEYLDRRKTALFLPEGLSQKNIYICKGVEDKATTPLPEGSVGELCSPEWRGLGQSSIDIEIFTPRFSYCGFRYVLVDGITAEQATEDLLTYHVMHSNIKERGNFSCSNEMANTLQTLTRRSTLANFHYFLTDCPHREKNGWTGDVAVSAEHVMLNLEAENSLREWLHNVRKAQDEKGRLPGIVPTGGWGYEWGNGPAWDCVLTVVSYYIYMYRGGKEILQENATSIFRYLHYLSTSRNGDGLLKLGLGDWFPVSEELMDGHKAPNVLTDSIISMDICNKAAFIFEEIGYRNEKEFARSLASQLRVAIREKLIDNNVAVGECQTSQAMALYYGVFDDDEKLDAFSHLKRFIDEKNGHIDTGILGARVIFHVLSEFGESDLAFNMITRPEYPSYGNWVENGATTLWENFHSDSTKVWSRNHHFWGDISGWFIRCIAGIQYNPTGKNLKEVTIAPSYIKTLDYAEAYHMTQFGKIEVKWQRRGDEIDLDVKVPDGFVVTKKE